MNQQKPSPQPSAQTNPGAAMSPAQPPKQHRLDRAKDAGLELAGVQVAYGTKIAVDNLDLVIPPGKIFALLGPSGCGKTSLLRAIAGLEPLMGGSIAWNGQDLSGVPPHQRGFGLMFQEGQLFGSYTVGGNVAYGLAGTWGLGCTRAGRLSRNQRRTKVGELLELVGLPGYAPRSVSTLSGGQSQRVALARALAPEPKVLLLDEPLSALDQSLRMRLGEDLRQILQTKKITALMVTHDQDEAFALADQVGVMLNGRLVQVGAPNEVWAQPATIQIAEFLGYGPFLNITEAARFGIVIASNQVLGLAAGALSVGDGGGDLVNKQSGETCCARVKSWRYQRGSMLVQVSLFDRYDYWVSVDNRKIPLSLTSAQNCADTGMFFEGDSDKPIYLPLVADLARTVILG